MLHLYGIVEPHGSCAVVGLGGEPLVPVACGDVVAVASEHAPALDPSPAEEALWQHEGVLEALLQAGPVLPVRFGVRFADREALRAEVEPRSAQLATVLEHVRGKVEVSVRLFAHEDADQPSSMAVEADTGPGARYFAERFGPRRDAAHKRDAVRAALAPLAVAERSHLLPRPGTLAAMAFLVERPEIERFRRRAAELEREMDDVVLVCTGPWPPYNFVDEPLKELA